MKDQIVTGKIEQFLRDNQLYYGTQPRSDGKASWMIAMNNHSISPEQDRVLTMDFPKLIGVFHDGSSRLMQRAFAGDPKLQRLNTYLTAGVPGETQRLWREAAWHGQSVFSSRPDMVVDPLGRFHVIEYNVDGGADKGNTLGINDYSREFIGEEPVGVNLAQLFVDGIRARFPDERYITVATVLPDNYRREYDAQNEYFARRASEYGKKRGIDWTAVHISDIYIGDNRVFAVQEGKKIPIDVIDREFKLPGFAPDIDFGQEARLVRAALDGQVDMLGSILPFQDKVLLITLFDNQYSSEYNSEQLSGLHSLHAETAMLDRDNPIIQLGERQYPLDDIYGLKPEFSIVLKRGGDTIGSTGSKGLVISQDTDPDTWKRELERALTEPLDGGNFWIVQRFYPSDKFNVRYMKSGGSQPKEFAVINRFAPYYLKDACGFRLGNVLVTAGTDEETRKRQRGNVHGLRQNTYQAVSVK